MKQDVWAGFRGAHNTPLTKVDYQGVRREYAEVYCTIQEGPKKMVGRQMRVLFSASEARHAAKQLLTAADKMEERAATAAEEEGSN